MTAQTGLDVSYCQTLIDWRQVKADQNVAYAWAQAMHGLATPDVMYHSHQSGAHSVGVPFGPYLYAYPTDPVQTAKNFCKMIGPHQLRACADIEEPTLSADWAYACLSEMEQILQYTPLGYTGSAYLQDHLHYDPRLEPFMQWIANYTGKPGDFGNYPPRWAWVAHQYTSAMNELGIVGRVDFDYAPDVSKLLIPGQPKPAGGLTYVSDMVAHSDGGIVVLNEPNGTELVCQGCVPWNVDNAKVFDKPLRFHCSGPVASISESHDGTYINVRFADGHFDKAYVQHGRFGQVPVPA